MQIPSNLPPVLFQFAQFDVETDVLEGFLINKSGEIRTSSISDIPAEYHYFEVRRIPDWVLEEIAEQSVATGLTVELSELNNHHRIVYRMREHSVTAQRSNPSAATWPSMHLLVCLKVVSLLMERVIVGTEATTSAEKTAWIIYFSLFRLKERRQ